MPLSDPWLKDDCLNMKIASAWRSIKFTLTPSLERNADRKGLESPQYQALWLGLSFLGSEHWLRHIWRRNWDTFRAVSVKRQSCLLSTNITWIARLATRGAIENIKKSIITNMWNIATGETSQAITHFHFFDMSTFCVQSNWPFLQLHMPAISQTPDWWSKYKKTENLIFLYLSWEVVP